MIIWWSFSYINSLMFTRTFFLDRFLDISIWGHNASYLHIAHAYIAVPFDVVSSSILCLSSWTVVVVYTTSSTIIGCNLSLLRASTWCTLKVPTQNRKHLVWVVIISFALVWMRNSFRPLVLEVVINVPIPIWWRYQLCAIVSWETPLPLIAFMCCRFWHGHTADVLVQGACLQRRYKTTLFLRSNCRLSWNARIRGEHGSHRHLVLFNDNNGCISLILFVINHDLSSRWISMLRTCDLRHQVVLIRWCLLLVLYILIDLPYVSAWYVYLLSSNWWFQNWVSHFVVHGVVPLANFDGISLLGIVEILCSVVHVVYAWHFAIQIVLEIHIFIETATSWACSWICWRLSLSFDWFDDLPVFFIYSVERINLTILIILRIVSKLSIWMPLLHLWWYYLLPSWSMLHVMRLLCLRSDVHLPVVHYHRWSVCAYFGRLLSSLSPWSSLTAVPGYLCCFRLDRVHLRSCLDGWRQYSFSLWFRLIRWQRFLCLLLLSISSILSSIPRCLLSLLLVLLPNHLLEFILVLLPEYPSSFLPLWYQIIACRRIIELVPWDIRFTFLNVDIIISVKKFHDILLDWNRILADDGSWFLFWFYLLIPRVLSYVFDRESLGWIWIEDWFDQIFAFLAEEAGQFVIRFQNLLI